MVKNVAKIMPFYSVYNLYLNVCEINKIMKNKRVYFNRK